MTPFDGAIAAARTCYSPRVISASEVTDGQRDLIGGLTFDAGHHTVYQHAHFEFGLENVSRQFVWAFLHSYPFYNSEQSSQRYVKLREPRAYVPPLAGRALDVFEAAVLRAWDRYAELSALLKDAYSEFIAENGLSPLAFPSLRQMECEVVSMAASILGGDDDVQGTMTSGGTESGAERRSTERLRCTSASRTIAR